MNDGVPPSWTEATDRLLKQLIDHKDATGHNNVRLFQREGTQFAKCRFCDYVGSVPLPAGAFGRISRNEDAHQ